MKQIKNKIALFLCSAMISQAAHAVLLVTGPTGTTDATTTSNNTIINLIQHKPSGMLVLTTTAGNSNNAIMTINRPTTTDSTVTASGIASDTQLQDLTITQLALVSDPTTPGDSTKAKIVVTKSVTGPETALFCLTTTVGTATTAILKDINGATTTRIAGLAAGNAGTSSCAFAAVYKNNVAGTNFGATAGDGIASVLINNTTLAMTQVNTTAAYALTTTIYSGGLNGTSATPVVAAGRNISMAYDQDLKKLYVALPGITTGGGGSTDVAWALSVWRVNADNGTLTETSPINSTTLSTARTVIAGVTNIIGTKGLSVSASAKHIQIMTTSTGPDASHRFKYLIVNGGNGAIATTGAKVYAIPLVVGNDDVAIDGYLAKVTSGDFKSIATGATDLYTSTSAAATVGNGNLPISASTDIASMYVDGDAVYVSINAAASVSAASDSSITPGLYVSQAIFDNLGKIAGWTDWHKITPNALGNTEAASRIGKFAVDSVTGHIAAVDGNAAKAVRMTQWSNTSKNQDGTANTKGLIYNLNLPANVGDGCTAVCDLNSSSTSWNTETPMRLAFFGGKAGKVCFAITGSVISSDKTGYVLSATNAGMTFDTSSSTATLDYSSTSTLTLTTLDTAAGTVRALGYTGWYPTSGSTTPGFFLAGAETTGGNGALYAYCAASLGVGMNVRSAFATTNPIPNAAFSWQQLTNVDGVPVKIESQGVGLYVLTRKVNSDGTSTDRIYRATRKITGVTLNADFLVTATAGETSGTVDLSAVKHIYDFVISSTGAGTEQLTMLTNDGVYTTTSAAGCDTAYTPATAMLNCGWVKVSSPATAVGFMLKFFQPTHSRTPQTFWAAQWAASQANAAVYDKVQLVQYGKSISTGDPASLALGQDSMINFNGNDGTTTVPTGLIEFPVVKEFMSDGARRFAIALSRSASSSTPSVLSVPFRVDSTLWNRTSAYTVSDAAVASLGNVYWIRPISGMVMIGTSNGVVALQ